MSAACDLLGIDPLYVANEGKLVAIVVAGRGRRGPGRAPGAPDRRPRGGGGRDQGRSRGHRRAAHDLRRHAHRRHARGRPAAAHLLTPVPDVAAVRHRIRVTGTVQGVGFRPFVYRQARRLGLHGWVQNDSAGVLLEVEGTEPAVHELARLLVDDPPPLARVASVEAQAIPVAGGAGFSILASASSAAATAPVSVDTATCAACLAEVDDPADRRFRYPFTNCTDCGPRYTIVRVRALRPARHDDGRLHDVPGVPGGVRRPLGPTVPRPAQRVPRVRPAALVDSPRGGWRSDGPRRRSPGRGGRCAPRRRDRRR